MADDFQLTVSLHGEEKHFSTQWQPWGYTHRFTVDVEGVAVFFEPDEEGHYRAVLAPDQDEALVRKLNHTWLEAIRQTIETTLE